MEWIVFDYGGVISFPPPEHAGGLLPRTVSADPDRFWSVYWRHRAAYDLGALSDGAYWRAVGADLDRSIDDDLVDVLAELDVRAWSYVNPATLELLAELDGSGAALALLSNAPAGMARSIDEQPWAALFRHRFFSADLGLAKPDPRIYRHVYERLDARPTDLTFVDDRAENTDAAGRLGIRPVLFTDATGLREALTPAG